MKHCHFVRTAGTLKQIFAKRMFWCYQGKITQDFNFIGNFNLSCSFSGRVPKKKTKKNPQKIVISLASKGDSRFQPALLNFSLLLTSTRPVPSWEILWNYHVFSSPSLPHFLTPILSGDRKAREKQDLFSVSCPMTQHGTSNLWPVTWKCFARHPRYCCRESWTEQPLAWLCLHGFER